MLTVIRFLPYLDPETQRKVVALCEEWGPKLESAEAGTTYFDDHTIKALIEEQRHVTLPSSAIPEKGSSQPVVRGSGWTEPRKWEPSKAQTEIFDAMVAKMAGGPNEPVK
jgi:hypothetical protein